MIGKPDAIVEREHIVDAVEEEQPESQEETVSKQSTQDQPSKPPKFHVVIHDDDYTPMDFVVRLLQKVFNYDYPTATDITIRVDRDGKAIAATYPFDIAESKAAQIVQNAMRNDYPLMADVEEADSE